MAKSQLALAPGSCSRWNVSNGSSFCGGRATSHINFCTSWQRMADNLVGRVAGLRQAHSIRATASSQLYVPTPLMDDSAGISCSTKWAKECAIVRPMPPRMQPSLEELARMEMPVLACSFPSEVHPLYEKVRAPSDRWIEAVAEMPTETGRLFLRKCLLPRLVCRFIPRALLTGRRLLQAIQLVAWLMIADDDDDNPEALGSNYAVTCHRANRIMAILTHPADDVHDHRLWNFDLLDRRLSMRCSRQLAALADLWREMSPSMSSLLRSRFISSMADYLEGIKVQAILRKEGHVPDMNTYMEIRRQASFTIPAFIIAEYASGVELDHAAVQNAKLVALCNKAVDYISLCNDIFSCYKEIILGDYFNLPSILYMHATPITKSAQPCASFQDAIDHVAQLAQDLDASCTSLIASLKDDYSKPGVDPLQAHNVHAYVDVIAFGMSGALDWFFETPRYPQPQTQGQLN